MKEITLEFSPYALIDILSICTAFTLGLLFFSTPSKNKKATVFLGLFLWSLMLEVVDSFKEILVPSFELYLQTTWFTLPLLVIYVQQTLFKRWQKWHSLLFVPGILANGIGIAPSFPAILEYLYNLGILGYLWMLISNHQKDVANYYSDLENKSLVWLKTIIYIFIAFHLLWIVEDLIGFQFETVAGYFAYLSNLGTYFMIFWIGYNGFSQPEIFATELFSVSPNSKKDSNAETAADREKYLELVRCIEERELYRNSNLNLKSLSEAVDIREKELSKLINTYANTNFYHFINTFRVETVKQLLTSDKAVQLSILGLATEAGFSSKSTFYAAFKNIEGCTPKQYQKRQQTSD